ncbi:hypothetical protein bas12_0066 [Escherichia phage BrunoManser]|uniref:Uncharacterized protein n=1 Tax=Escherichia phage BrunoManser TaxID=2851976 RepID=A0AAE7VPT1_9CAUD|nr:hypothetical protein bas12_0066 [Escherichia phage BrunoManser]
MKITLTEQYFSDSNPNRYIITEGMTTETELKVNQTIGSLVLVSAKELDRFAKPEHRHLADPLFEGGEMPDYPFLEGEYRKANPFSFWNKLKSGKLFK